MLSRTESRARAAIERIQDEVPSAQVEFIPFDLCSLKSCKKAAEGFLTKEDRLDAVICNAGIVS
jgi:NAD(P)-dependent dehydrogenase (short-subunit alcohol dehydrogenase family)